MVEIIQIENRALLSLRMIEQNRKPAARAAAEHIGKPDLIAILEAEKRS